MRPMASVNALMSISTVNAVTAVDGQVYAGKIFNPVVAT